MLGEPIADHREAGGCVLDRTLVRADHLYVVGRAERLGHLVNGVELPKERQVSLSAGCPAAQRFELGDALTVVVEDGAQFTVGPAGSAQLHILLQVEPDTDVTAGAGRPHPVVEGRVPDAEVAQYEVLGGHRLRPRSRRRRRRARCR